MAVQEIKVPQLRFKEFSEDWELKKLNDITSLITKGTTPKYFSESGINYVKIESLNGINVSLNKCLFIDEKTNTNELKRSILNENDILFAIAGATIGKLGVVTKDILPANTNQALSIIRLENSKSIHFYIQLLQSEIMKRYIEMNISVGAQPNLNLKQIGDFIFASPQLPEQKKIATFLTAVDKKIALLQQKKIALEQYKKGVMQQLFSQQLRFKPALSGAEGDDNGNAYSDWEEKRLGEVTKYYDGTHQTPKYVKEGVPFYSVEHVTANQFEKTKFISEEVFQKENKRVKLEKGDILMTRIGNVGKAKYIDWDVRASFYVSLALIKKDKSFSSKYLSQYINGVPFQRELWKRIIHVAFPQKINLGELGNCILKLPSLEEQTKIAKYLSTMDAKIALVDKQLSQTQQFKKGLLQQLFV